MGNIRLKNLNYEVHKEITKNPVILRKIQYDYEDKSCNVWLEYPSFQFRQLKLTKGDELFIDFHEFVCPKCHQQVISLEHGLCNRCINPEDPFRIRLNCLFREPESYLSQYGNCTKDDPPCGIKRNTKYCHSPHILYIGSLGNKIKIGISRKNRRGGYLQRLYEQGLNQAIVINDFESRIAAMQEENWFVDINYCSRIHFDEKIELITHQPKNLEKIFTQSMLEERFPEQEIEYYNIHTPLLDYSLQKRVKPIDGEIDTIIGPMLIMNDMTVFDIRQLSNRMLSALKLNQEELV